MRSFLTSPGGRYKLSGLMLLFSVSSCGSPAPLIRDRLDPLTAVTIAHATEPLVLYRDSSSRAAFARDFVNLGPIRVNRMGQQRYFLWLGFWSTMQDGGPTDATAGFESVIVFADGEPLRLTLAGSTPSVIGASTSAYVKPAAILAEAYYAVTIDQLRLIAEARDLRLQTSGPRPRSYEPWDGRRSGRGSLQAFLAFMTD